MAVKELTSEQFHDFVKSAYAIVDCYGENCAACVMLEPVFEAAAVKLSGISFGKINLTYNMEVAQEYAIEAMPTMLFFRNGTLVNQFSGCVETDDLLGLVAQLLYQ